MKHSKESFLNLRKHNEQLLSYMFKEERKKVEIVDMIDNFDYIHGNAFSLLRQIKNTLTKKN